MICFDSLHLSLFNYIIHHFLELEVINDETDIGDMIELLLPKYLYREQYLKCKKTYEELFYWTEDQFYHSMSAFHELALYHFLNYMSGLRDAADDFDQVYFDEKGRAGILEACKLDYEEYGQPSPEDRMEEYFNVFGYIDILFDDIDFLEIEHLYNRRYGGFTDLEDILGINLDFYFELLPLDIQEKYKTGHITLTGEVTALLDYLTQNTDHGSLYKLFWENDAPVKEDRIQIILENIMDAYFHNKDIDITREAQLGSGKVDFKLYKNESEKILIEIKRASSSYLKKGYETQLTNYLRSSQYKNAFYLIACFTDEEYEKTVHFISEHIYTDTVQLYINISILDLRKRKTPSAA